MRGASRIGAGSPSSFQRGRIRPHAPTGRDPCHSHDSYPTITVADWAERSTRIADDLSIAHSLPASSSRHLCAGASPGGQPPSNRMERAGHTSEIYEGPTVSLGPV